MAKKTGYTLVKGNAGEAVGKAATIYSSRLCKGDIIRSGLGVKGGKDYYNYHMGDSTFEEDKREATPTNNINQYKADALNARATFGQAFDDYKKDENNMFNKIKKKNAPQETSVEPSIYEEGNPNKDGTLTQHPKYLEASVTHTEQLKRFEKLQLRAEKLMNISFPAVSVASVTQWFDDMEALIDALPELNEDNTIIYFVEYDEDKEDWFYTGESGERDPWWNKKMLQGKTKVCAWLNAQAQKTTDKVTNTLQDLANRTTACKPFTVAMETISKVPSLNTIIKWATAVIDYFLAQYKLIKAYIDMIMTLLELVIIRFPQLINKIMQKITSFNCPVRPKVTSVKININKPKK